MIRSCSSLFDPIPHATSHASSRPRDRKSIPLKYTWNLTHLFANDASWREAKDRLKGALPDIERFQGTLSSSADVLFSCLEMASTLYKEFARLYVYASMLHDEDTRISSSLAMQQEISQIGSDLNARGAFIEPEILKLEPDLLAMFALSEPRLAMYRHYLEDIQRRRPHTGDEGEERIIADAGLMAEGSSDIHGIFANAEFPYPTVTLTNKKRITLDQANFTLYRAVPNRKDRRLVFEKFFASLNTFRRTFGTQLNAEVRKNLFYTRVRKYDSPLHSALDANSIPVAVYHNLIENVNKNLGTFHRYLRLRKHYLRVPALHYFDLYAPLLKRIDIKYSYDEACSLVLDSLRPLGEEYCSVVRRAFTERWIDVFPTTAKRSGAYSNGAAYDVHPYILLNYNGKFDDVSTLTHELGHTMHSYYSNAKQPFATSQYAIFVAEVASTFNEALLMDHMLKTIDDDRIRLSLLGNLLENIKGTVFRQAQFAEFELQIHKKVQDGEALTGDNLNALYLDVTRKYYGHGKRICTVDDVMESEWMIVSHFYYDFYVYQYATAFTASAALSEQVLAGDERTRVRYIDFLSSGSSDYPINLLKSAGVDMTTSLPFELTMQKMNRVMDEMERISSKKRK